MNNLFRGLIAGVGAKKLGGGCFSTILIFIIIYWALGTCNTASPSIRMQKPAKEVRVIEKQHQRIIPQQ